MSYEYMLGMGAAQRQPSGRKRPSGRRRGSGRQGGGRQGASRQQPSRQELLAKVAELCGTGCSEKHPEPFFFSGSDPRKTRENRRQAQAKKCAFRCLDDDGGYYYCCPSGEKKKKETSEEASARIAAACGGEPCSEPGRMTDSAIKSDSPNVSEQKNKKFNQGCLIRCEEGGWIYYCCPSADRPQETGPVLPEFAEVPVTEQDDGSWGTVAVLGLLGLGIAGFAGYWFLLRKED